ncbi:hypothetical protein ACRALDRAFT_1080515 [Sodiomyces alcalophilus JCM 7366]|uniref:uncharacterized protein n=1 Tax=Sodiomyces alcalophilus JCM 7366 TaxID=591952 RepID=UPI0039B514BA
MANPILKAVHNSTQITPIESDLLPHIRERDAASSTFANKSTELRDTIDALTATESQTLRASRRNAELAKELLELAEEAERRKKGDAGSDPELQSQLETLRAEVKESRQKWRVMKGTASAVVVGSGVDWVRDEELRQIVLDPEDDNEEL